MQNGTPQPGMPRQFYATKQDCLLYWKREEGHRERNTERNPVTSYCTSATKGPLWPALIICYRFITILIGGTTLVELAGVETMLETGTRRLDECNWVFRNRDAFTTTRAHLLPHYRLRGENILSTTVAKYNDGVTAHWGVEDISPVAETIQWPITVMATFISQREEARIEWAWMSVSN